MCGIAGFVVKNKKTNLNFSKILNLMKSRGPDNQNFIKTNLLNNEICFFSSRLKIIDLEDLANQPFRFRDYILSFNGELYNFIEIRKELENLGRNFKTKSDTEVVIQAFDEWQTDCFKKFDGMWAVSILDLKNKKVILSRDFFGEKPLFYHSNVREFFYGSEIKYLHSFKPQLRELNLSKLNDYLINGYKSLFKDNNTYFKYIKSVNPGQIITIKLKDLSIKKEKILLKKKYNHIKNYNDILSSAKNIFFNSFEKRLRSDVPVSFCLSGGIDSGGLVSIAKKKFGLDPHCFSIVNEDIRYNENENINYLKKYFNLKVDKIKIPKLNFEKFSNRLDDLISYRQSPVSTLSYYMHSYISEKCKKRNFKVIFSGTGADEIFTGYYDHTLFFLNEIKKNKLFKKEKELWETHTKKFIRNKKLKLNIFLKNPFYREHIYNDKIEMNKYFKSTKSSFFNEKNYTRNNLKNRLLNELYHESVPVILYEDDLNSMKYSIENRSPYLSKNLLDLLQSINPKYYIKDGYTKNILREILSGYLPDKIRLDRKKIGFNSTIHDIVDLNFLHLESLIINNDYLKEIIKPNFIKNLRNKRELSNSESKLIFNLINVGLFTQKQ